MYRSKEIYERIQGTLKILPVKTDAEIQRVLSVYDISLETLNQNVPDAISLG